MDFLTACHTLTARLPELAPGDPIVRAALDLAVRPWLDGVHSGAQAMRWGSFATEVQAVADLMWPGAAAAQIRADPPGDTPGLDDAVRDLIGAAADMLSRAASPGHAMAWEYSAAATQLREATLELG